MDENALEQTQLLCNIWNEMKTPGSTLGGRIDQTNQRLDQTTSVSIRCGSSVTRIESKLDEDE